jgi:pilus assembly protein CpaB
MRSKSTILLVIALGCGMIASVGISQVVLDRKGSNTQKMVEVFVAVKDIDVRDKIAADKIKLEKWPADRVPEGFLNDLKKVEGKFANQRLFAGEPLLEKKLADTLVSPGDSVPQGYRLVTLSGKPHEVINGFARPGDHVDVICYFPKSSFVKRPTTKTVLTDVRIFAMDSQTQLAAADEQGTAQPKTYSLLIREEDQEAWTWADELGNIRLSLCPPRKKSDKESDETGPSAASQEFLAWLETQQDEPVASQAPATTFAATAALPAVEVPAGKPTESWDMVALTPSGATVFHWDDVNNLPRVVGAEGTPASASSNDAGYLNGSSSPFFQSDANGGQPAPNSQSSPAAEEEESAQPKTEDTAASNATAG